MRERDRLESTTTKRQAVPRNLRMPQRFLDNANRHAPFPSNNVNVHSTQVGEKSNPVLSKVSQDAGTPKRVHFSVVGGLLPFSLVYLEDDDPVEVNARLFYHDYAGAGTVEVVLTDAAGSTSTIASLVVT